MTELQEVAQAMWEHIDKVPFACREQTAQYVALQMPLENFTIRQGVTDALWSLCRQPPAAQ